MADEIDPTRRLRRALERALHPEHLEIEDESRHHAGHREGGGGGHFRVLVVSDAFRGHGMVARQRQVYAALGAALGSEIHALAMRTLTPEEWREAAGARPGGFRK